MATVIRLAGLVTGTPTVHDGRYVVEYHACAAMLLKTTDKKEGALRFPNVLEAINYYRQECGIRADGLPNRPLTAFSAEFLNVELTGKTATTAIIDDIQGAPHNAR